jgi:transcriptional regulator with XRE-family HTH domain
MAQEAWERRLGKTIRAARMKRGLTLQRAADAYGCDLRHWQFYEQGKPISVRTLLRISKALSIKPSKLLDW